ncbi:MAG: hypothetical protein JWM89_942 [Acidimicrobiales bacterium]|nr:hypothetical protein [Acidimicrobiales bacterium]
MTREAVVASCGVVTILGCAWLLLQRAGGREYGLAGQVGVAAVCGLVGALAATVPYADAVPDRLERLLELVLATAAALVVALLAWRTGLEVRRRYEVGPPRRALQAPRAVAALGPGSDVFDVRPVQPAPRVLAPPATTLRCSSCGGSADTIDHVTRWSARFADEHVVVTCWRCAGIWTDA